MAKSTDHHGYNQAIIKRLRRARGWSMDQLAERLGTTFATINRIERGDTQLIDQRLALLADALDLTPLELVGELMGPAAPTGFAESSISAYRAEDAPELAHATFGDNKFMSTICILATSYWSMPMPIR